MSEKILQVKGLKVYFNAPSGVVRAVDGVSFDVERRSVFGLVGESGSGKTLTALSILGLIGPPGKIAGGGIYFDDMDLIKEDEKILRGIRGARIAMVFQEPSRAFNPVFTIGYQITESALTHQELDRKKAESLAIEFLEKVHIPDPKKIYHDYPHQLSGGAKQRAMIAMALVNSPELIILDEPTTALDVTIQAQILDLLKEIIEKERLSILFISHDFGIVSRMCDSIAVMHKGRIVEAGITKDILSRPNEPYTISLLESVKALL